MAAPFNAEEVLEMALQIERNGGRFYRSAAAQAAEPSVRQTLSELAEMEEDHEELFAEIKRALSGRSPFTANYDPNGEAASYLRAAAETHVFNVQQQLADALAEADDAAKVLSRAIQFEKDSVVFFLGLLRAVPEGLGRSDVERLIAEEMDHIGQLSRRLSELSA